MLQLFDNESHSRGKDFQFADSTYNIATAIMDMVFPALKQGTKQSYPYPYIFFKSGGIEPYPPNLMGQLNVLWHYSYLLSMYSTQICILKQIHCISLHHLLQGKEGSGLKMQVATLLLCNFPHPLHEGQFTD